MTKHCDDLIPLILRAVDDTISPADRATLDAHLTTCSECAEALADQQAMRASLATLAADTPVTHVGARVLATLRAEADSRTRDSWADLLDFKRWTWRLVPVALVMAMATAGVTTGATTTANTSDPTAPSASSTTTGTTYSMASSVLLADDVSGADVLSLLLNASADQQVTAAAPTTTGGER